MKVWTRFAMVLALMLTPLVASAQFRGLDQALGNLSRGFGNGDAQAIVAGIGDTDKVVLQFPGLAEQSGPFGRDQAQLLLDSLFNHVKPTGFEEVTSGKNSAEGQYHIQARWTIVVGGKPQARDLYITLRDKGGDRYTLLSVTSGSK